MITEEHLKIHDDLELKTTSRPWASVIRRRPGYGSIIFWSRRPGSEVMFDNADDARYLTFARNLMPELVKSYRELKAKVLELEEKLKNLT